MSKKILIDGAFKEETRVALIEDNVLQNYDREDFNFKQLKGNIYLAKVTRIEPSLQAAFIDYGGDRHGFLPFSDIHPDYYNIPKSEIKNLKEVKFFQINDEIKKEVNEENVEELDKSSEDTNNSIDISNTENVDNIDISTTESLDNNIQADGVFITDSNSTTILVNAENEQVDDETLNNIINKDEGNVAIEKIDDTITSENLDNSSNDNEDSDVDIIPNYSVDEETDIATNNVVEPQYKIEDVIKEGQYLLVQVLKEERGNKGVAMTTYISIAGKYCVLMVNTPGRGGVSKKVTNINDRKILKSILRSLNVAEDKSIILRTAGVGKKPEDILKDYLYLVRLWKAIKETTLESKAPAFIHAEDDIIKKTIRDLYTDDIDEIIVEGEEIYKSIASLAKIISPDQNPIVKLHNDKIPLFQSYNVENQLLELYNNKVILPSGGSIVIDQTEALVAIDVNSGKATKEKTVEEMAVATNVEAAKEIARQLKLRDLGGLVVIDYIDMFELKNRRIVEKAMRDAMSTDRARIQIARLSIFGLMELSRQRLGASFMERSSEVCPRCSGKGKIKSKEIVALSILRAIKYASNDKQINVVVVETTLDLCDYLLNFKRREINNIEKDYGIYVFVECNEHMEDNNYTLKKRKGLTPEEKRELEPQQKMGKVNLSFDDESYSVSNDDIKKYKFNEEIYESNEKAPRRVNKKQYNKYNKFNYNNNNNKNKKKKENWFRRLLGI